MRVQVQHFTPVSDVHVAFNCLESFPKLNIQPIKMIVKDFIWQLKATTFPSKADLVLIHLALVQHLLLKHDLTWCSCVTDLFPCFITFPDCCLFYFLHTQNTAYVHFQGYLFYFSQRDIVMYWRWLSCNVPNIPELLYRDINNIISYLLY